MGPSFLIVSKNAGKAGMKRKDPPFITSKSRIEALTDGVYAIAMTLVALNLTIPELMEMNEVRPQGPVRR